MKKIVSSLVIFILCASYAVAQQRDLLKEYEEFKKKTAKDYGDFRKQSNANYVEFMRQAWKEFSAEPAIPTPPSPDPPKPTVAEPGEKPANDSIPLGGVIPPVATVTPPEPLVPISVNPIPVLTSSETTPLPTDVPLFSFSFYNTECRIRLDSAQKIHLQNISEEAVADAWETLSGDAFNPTVADCLHLREELSLCDWGYYQLIQTIADRYYGADNPNESVLFQVFILTQSGYKIRIVRADDRLAALVPFDHTIFTYAYLTIDGSKYYVMNKNLKTRRFYVCNYSFPNEQFFSIQINSLPKFKYTPTVTNILEGKRYPVKIEVESNKNLIDFFNSYPLSSEWNLYARASLSEHVKEQFYPVLKNDINGKNQQDAVNIILNFVQTAFTYQLDEDQFGYERPLFGDETLFYPGSNCKDRSILFSILVKELLNLDVVLLHYPGHLATAVRFNENVEGDYLMINGQKYIICDPTYIGAVIGQEMPVVKNTKPQAVGI